AIVPAAGIVIRMGADCHKQYMKLAGNTILEHTLERLLYQPAIAQVIVALAPHDHRFEAKPVAADKLIERVEGCAER
ncbi:2-C-methyl-D-erythritol 4-phosphate cytidylyltransferase, partial [Aeromonas veronii]|uniref:2-C-methyl-D-erythritol 4-phosphate cytidylyltransferase n=1 Tax=Aeromonas veronii TaxID=654 RepID=UPI0038B666FE